MKKILTVSGRLLALRNILYPFAPGGGIRWSAVAIWYLLANAFHIASWNAKFWDQWYLYSEVKLIEAIDRTCPVERCKVPFTYLWEAPLFGIGHWTVRVAVVSLYWWAGVLFWKLLRRTPQLNEQQRTIATIFFLLLPINGARIGLSTARYSLVLVLLIGGALLITRRKPLPVLLGLLLVGYSQFQPSHQVFALAILIPLIGSDLSARSKISTFTWTISSVLIVLPFLHRYFFTDLIVNLGFAGPSDEYNSIQIAFLVRAILVCLLLTMPINSKLINHMWRKRSIRDFQTSSGEVGLLLLALGTFPYLAVGHFANLTDWVTMWLPDTSDWDSRHQILQGFGFSILGLGAVQLVDQSKQRRVTLLLLTVFFVLSTSIYANYYVDSLKQRDILAQLQRSPEDLRKSEFIMFVDVAKDLNARGRLIRDYEFKAMIKAVLDVDVSIYSQIENPLNCIGQNRGSKVTIRKVSGRLRAILTRSEVVKLEFSPLIICS